MQNHALRSGKKAYGTSTSGIRAEVALGATSREHVRIAHDRQR